MNRTIDAEGRKMDEDMLRIATWSLEFDLCQMPAAQVAAFQELAMAAELSLSFQPESHMRISGMTILRQPLVRTTRLDQHTIVFMQEGKTVAKIINLKVQL